MHTPHQDDIRDRAYALWVEAGSPDHRDDEFWHRAELELAEEGGPDGSEDASGVAPLVPPFSLPTK